MAFNLSSLVDIGERATRKLGLANDIPELRFRHLASLIHAVRETSTVDADQRYYELASKLISPEAVEQGWDHVKQKAAYSPLHRLLERIGVLRYLYAILAEDERSYGPLAIQANMILTEEVTRVLPSELRQIGDLAMTVKSIVPAQQGSIQAL